MRKLLEELAFVTHFGLTLGHGLGAYYNYRKSGIGFWFCFHTAAVLLDGKAIHTHLKAIHLEELREQRSTTQVA